MQNCFTKETPSQKWFTIVRSGSTSTFRTYGPKNSPERNRAIGPGSGNRSDWIREELWHVYGFFVRRSIVQRLKDLLKCLYEAPFKLWENLFLTLANLPILCGMPAGRWQDKSSVRRIGRKTSPCCLQSRILPFCFSPGHIPDIIESQSIVSLNRTIPSKTVEAKTDIFTETISWENQGPHHHPM